MELIPLGTAAGKPIHGRHLPSMALVINGRIILFDCGEAAQFQLLQARLRSSRIDVICITHLHGDHFYGLPGLISTMALNDRQHPLTIIGPEDLAGILDQLPGTRANERSYDIRFIGLSGEGMNEALRTENYFIKTRPLEHRTVTFGYRVQLVAGRERLDGNRAKSLGIKEPEEFRALKQGRAVTMASGRTIHPEDVSSSPKPTASIAYVSDTRPCVGGLELAQDVSLLIHEATYLHKLLHKAKITKHTTAIEAADLAKKAGARNLLLTHYSSRYPNPDILAAEAKTVFENSDIARELEIYPIK